MLISLLEVCQDGGSRRGVLGRLWGFLTGDMEDMVIPDVMSDVFLPLGRYPENFVLISQLKNCRKIRWRWVGRWFLLRLRIGLSRSKFYLIFKYLKEVLNFLEEFLKIKYFSKFLKGCPNFSQKNVRVALLLMMISIWNFQGIFPKVK